jgi:hypothetical protein
MAPAVVERVRAIVSRYPSSVGLSADDLLAASSRFVAERTEQWPQLMCCRIDSFAAAIAQCAEMRLAPDYASGDAYLVAKRMQGEWRAHAIPGVRGIEKSLMRSGRVTNLQSWCVFSQDEFEVVEGGEHDPVIRRPLMGYDPNVPNLAIRGVTRMVLSDGRKHVEVQVISADDRENMGLGSRSPIETAVKNSVQRAAARHVIRTYLFDDPLLTRLIEIDGSFWDDARGIDPSLSMLADRSALEAFPLPRYQVREHGEQPPELNAQQLVRQRLAATHQRVLQESLGANDGSSAQVSSEDQSRSSRGIYR